VLVIAACMVSLAPHFLLDDEQPRWLAAASKALVTLGVSVAAGGFITWLGVAMSNLVRWDLRPRWSGDWALWCWFIPVLPLLVMRDVARRSGSGTGGTVLIVGWWVTYVGGASVGLLFFRGPVFAESQICAAVLAIVVVSYITDLQERRQAEFDPAP
jgi:Domain of unknown function (DUF4328)